MNKQICIFEVFSNLTSFRHLLAGPVKDLNEKCITIVGDAIENEARGEDMGESYIDNLLIKIDKCWEEALELSRNDIYGPDASDIMSEIMDAFKYFQDK